jgi:cold shock CspA family protein
MSKFDAAPAAAKSTGTCKRFGNCTGFGFIHVEDGMDVFVHITDCVDGMMPVEGDVLLYDLGPSKKKPGQMAALSVTGGSAKQTAEERNNGGKGKGWGTGATRSEHGDMKYMMLMRKLEEKMGEIKKDLQVLMEGKSASVQCKAERDECGIARDSAMADLQNMMNQKFDARLKKMEQSIDMLHERTIECGYNSRTLQLLHDKVAKQQKAMNVQEAEVVNQNEEMAEQEEAHFEKLEKYDGKVDGPRKSSQSVEIEMPGLIPDVGAAKPVTMENMKALMEECAGFKF